MKQLLAKAIAFNAKLISTSNFKFFGQSNSFTLGPIFFLQLLALTACTSCTSQPSTIEEEFDPRHDALFSYHSDIVNLHEVHQLSKNQQDEFLAYINSSFRANIPIHELVYDYLDDITDKFNYQESTFTAETTFTSRRGNCMSLAVLTTALAQLAGVPVEYQLVDADPVYGLSRNLAVRGVHVRTHLIDPNWQASPGQLILRKPGLLVDYFPSGKERFIANLNANQYAARFYLNLAVEHLQQGDLDKSYWLVVTALEHDPVSADGLNTLAIIYRRKGSYHDAERIYQHAIEHLPNKLSVLRNYELMLDSLGRSAEALTIRSRLRRLNDPSPFSWYRGAQVALEKGDLADAEYYFEKAIERAPYMPELRYGLAKVFAEQGHYDLALAQIEQSLENVWGADRRAPYRAKLKWLQRKNVDS